MDQPGAIPSPLDTTPQTPPPRRATRGRKLLFWLAAGASLMLCLLMTQITALLVPMQRSSVEAALGIPLLITLSALASVNFTAIYGAAYVRASHPSPLVVLVWVVFVVAAIIGDVRCVMGGVRSLILGPTLP